VGNQPVDDEEDCSVVVTDEDGCVSVVGYGNNERCTFNMPAVPLHVVQFDTEECCDKLIVNGHPYSGHNGPESVIPNEPLFWFSDSSVSGNRPETEHGSASGGSFKICPVGSNGSNPVGNLYQSTGDYEWGGQCTCPDGQTYDVSDNGNDCGSLQCINGEPGRCYAHDEAGFSAPVELGMQVICAPAAPGQLPRTATVAPRQRTTSRPWRETTGTPYRRQTTGTPPRTNHANTTFIGGVLRNVATAGGELIFEEEFQAAACRNNDGCVGYVGGTHEESGPEWAPMVAAEFNADQHPLSCIMVGVVEFIYPGGQGGVEGILDPNILDVKVKIYNGSTPAPETRCATAAHGNEDQVDNHNEEVWEVSATITKVAP